MKWMSPIFLIMNKFKANQKESQKLLKFNFLKIWNKYIVLLQHSFFNLVKGLL